MRSHSRTARAQLIFSISFVEHHLRESHPTLRMSDTVTIFFTAILEALTRRLLELAGIEAQQRGRNRITPELLDSAIHSNAELNDLLGSTIISQVSPRS